MGDTLETVLKILGPTAGVLTAIITWWLRRRSEFLPKSPLARLKNDIEILKGLKETDHPKYDVVKQHIDLMVQQVYEKPPQQTGFKFKKPRETVLFVMGIIAVVGFSFWTWYLVRDAFTWWAIGTGFGIITGIGWIGLSYEDRVSPPTDPYYCTKCNKYHKLSSAIGIQHISYKGTDSSAQKPSSVSV
ncbi:hypothetical protein ACFLYQ_00575 [Chloroflexota bacterium]